MYIINNIGTNKSILIYNRINRELINNNKNITIYTSLAANTAIVRDLLKFETNIAEIFWIEIITNKKKNNIEFIIISLLLINLVFISILLK